jgi:hypothetical protein
MSKKTLYSILIIIVFIAVIVALVMSYKKEAPAPATYVPPGDTTMTIDNSIDSIGLDDASIDNELDAIDREINSL